MTPEHHVPLTGLQMEAQTEPFRPLDGLRAWKPIGTPRAYAKVAEEFLDALELLPDDERVAVRPRAYLAAQALECVLKAFITCVDKSRLDALKKPGEKHDLFILTQIAEQLSQAGARKMSIPSPADLPLWWEELAFLHGKPYLNRYPSPFPTFVLEVANPGLAGRIRPLLKEAEAAIALP